MAKKTKAPRRGRRQAFESLTLEEVRRLIRSTDRIEIRALFELALTTGMRREDIAKIDRHRIDFKKAHLEFWEKKKKRNWRVFLEPDVVATLRMYVRTLPKSQRELFDFTGRTAYNYLQTYLRAAGIDKHIRFHDMRTTFIRLSRKMGREVKYVMQQTGDSAEVILEHYDYLSDEEMHEITNNGILRKAEETNGGGP